MPSVIETEQVCETYRRWAIQHVLRAVHWHARGEIGLALLQLRCSRQFTDRAAYYDEIYRDRF